jgi:phosphoribosylformimino-5-aminoimidazole carboxamide ribotide isomerase
MLLIPSIDLRAGQCVRLLRGDFERETRYQLDPQELLLRYRSLGASWLHVVDLDGARAGAAARSSLNRRVIEQLAAQSALPLQVGGGVRSAALIEELLQIGVARVVVGSAAVERPDEVSAWLEHYGNERLCLAFDLRLDERGAPRLRTHGWRQSSAQTLWEAVATFADRGLKHLLCTDIDRDGALGGPNVALYQEALRRFPALQWQASGGIASGADLSALAAAGLPAAISGTALLQERIALEELRPFLPNA